MKHTVFVCLSALVLSACAQESAQVASTDPVEAGSRSVLSAPAPHSKSKGVILNEIPPKSIRLNSPRQINNEKVDILLKARLRDSQISRKVTTVKSKKELKAIRNFHLDDFTDDATFWVAELDGELKPAQYAMPRNDDGSVREITYKKGILVINPEDGVVQETILYN